MQTKHETIEKSELSTMIARNRLSDIWTRDAASLAYLAKWSELEFALKELDMLRTPDTT